LETLVLVLVLEPQVLDNNTGMRQLGVRSSNLTKAPPMALINYYRCRRAASTLMLNDRNAKRSLCSKVYSLMSQTRAVSIDVFVNAPFRIWHSSFYQSTFLAPASRFSNC